MNLSDEARTLVRFLSKFRCMTIEQIEKMYKHGEYESVDAMISYLLKVRCLRMDEDKFVFVQSESSYSPEELYCIWVLLDKIKPNSGHPISSTNEIKSANPCDNGIEICFINKNKIIEYITFVSKSDISKVSMIQDTFYTTTGVRRGSEQDSRRKYTFVVTDENTMDILADMDLTIPFEVAFVEGSYAGIPKIEYYGL